MQDIQFVKLKNYHFGQPEVNANLSLSFPSSLNTDWLERSACSPRSLDELTAEKDEQLLIHNAFSAGM